jgi:hypothetical protein
VFPAVIADTRTDDLAICALMNLAASPQPGLTFSSHARGTAGCSRPRSVKETCVMNSGPEYHNLDRAPSGTEILDTGHASPRRRTHLAGLLAVALIALAGGAGVAYAAANPGSKVATDSAASSQSQTPSANTSPSARSWSGGRPGGFGRFGGFGAFGGFGGFGLGDLGGAIHGQFTEPKPGGGYQTVEVQRGAVTDVSSSSISVRSADGFSATYAVSSSTDVNAMAAGIGTVKVGDTVDLAATVSRGTATAASLIDITAIRASRGAFGFPAGPLAGTRN